MKNEHQYDLLSMILALIAVFLWQEDMTEVLIFLAGLFFFRTGFEIITSKKINKK